MNICGCCGSALTDCKTGTKLYAFTKFDLFLSSAAFSIMGAAVAIVVQFYTAFHQPVLHSPGYKERNAYVVVQASIDKRLSDHLD